jgi:histone chaperone ASF1
MYLLRNRESRDSQSSGETHKINQAPAPKKLIYVIYRDSEDSAPAEYPPEQPEADVLDDDGAAYGAEEAELQAALELELEATEAKLANTAKAEPIADVDMEMAGVEQMEVEPTSKEADEEGSEAGSEDLEAESSGSEDEDEEEEGEGEGEADEDMEMGDGEGEGKPADEGAATNGEQKSIPQQGHAEVMVH